MPAPFLVKTLQLVILNLSVFLAYRLLFLAFFAGRAALPAAPTVLLHGLRLDVALLSGELACLGGLALACRRVRYRAVLAALWGVTYLNVLSAVANLLFFRERNQHVWEMLLANLGRPAEILVAMEPFVYAHPLVVAALLVFTAATIGAASRHGRAVAGEPVDLWRTPRVLGPLLASMAILSLMGLETVSTRRRTGGWEPGVLASVHHMPFGDYVLNQAVINPLYDLVRYYVPSRMAVPRYELDPQQALEVSRRLLDLPPGDARYPLLRTIRNEAPLGIRNVILIQVEGLGRSILDHRADGGYIMATVRELGERGLYFPNIVQSFCATDGAVFATATGLPRPFRLGDGFFFPYELNGLYSSLPHSLGTRQYRHYFFAAFRERIADYVGFMRNLGYEAFGYAELRARLGERAEEKSDALGIFDGPMLREAAAVILGGASPFTAHIITATSHSPWTVPPGMAERHSDDRLATFQYVDRSIHDFVEMLRAQLPDFDRTLFAIIGDHTSVTFGGSYSERIGVPLVLFNTKLAKERERWADRVGVHGSHIDLLATILALVDGEHAYSGMGRNLLGADSTASGVISSTHASSLYLKGGFALEYVPSAGIAKLLPIENGDIITRDVSAEHPDVLEQLRIEYLALSETSERLTRERRLVPLP